MVILVSTEVAALATAASTPCADALARCALTSGRPLRVPDPGDTESIRNVYRVRLKMWRARGEHGLRGLPEFAAALEAHDAPEVALASYRAGDLAFLLLLDVELDRLLGCIETPAPPPDFFDHMARGRGARPS